MIPDKESESVGSFLEAPPPEIAWSVLMCCDTINIFTSDYHAVEISHMVAVLSEKGEVRNCLKRDARSAGHHIELP
jgi:hypothetical protein